MGRDPLLLSFIVVIIGGLGIAARHVVAALLIGLGDGIVSVFFSPDARQDDRHAAGRAGAGVPAARPVRRRRRDAGGTRAKVLAAASGR